LPPVPYLPATAQAGAHPAPASPRPAALRTELANPAGIALAARRFVSTTGAGTARPGRLATRGWAAALSRPQPYKQTCLDNKTSIGHALAATARLIPSRRARWPARPRRLILIMTAARPCFAVQRANRRPIKNLPGAWCRPDVVICVPLAPRVNRPLQAQLVRPQRRKWRKSLALERPIFGPKGAAYQHDPDVDRQLADAIKFDFSATRPS
jgi:hypothetical protein